ncbi:ankyrin repeat-containing domain protein, partial [Bisporella sp. PMI_857]
LSFEATHGAGGYSIAFGLRTSRMVRKLPLESFFRDLYRDRWHRNKKVSRHSYITAIYNMKEQNKLLKVIERQLLEAFNSGKASPDDVDKDGRTLLHATSLFNRLGDCEQGFGGRIFQLLISMGIKTDFIDNNLRTAQQLLVNSDHFQIPRQRILPGFSENVIEWTGLPTDEVIDGVEMIEYMRCWPESIDEWGYPYISDILLRKSKSDLESFVRHGMRPKEETSQLLTPLHLAAAANWPEAVMFLLANRADKYAQDSNSQFPIDFAIKTECLESTNLLLDGDCLPYFTSPRKTMWDFLDIPVSIFRGLIGISESVRSALLGAIFRQKDSLEHKNLYHSLINNVGDGRLGRIAVRIVEALLSEGVPGLNTYNDLGYTPLMKACNYYNFELVRVLVENGASISECHRDSGLTAGHFLAASGYLTPPPDSAGSDPRGILLQIGFDMSNMAKFSCRCSPGGYTPFTAIVRRYSRRPRDYLHIFIDCLRWPTETLEKEIRTFALVMTFDRLGMTHTCVRIDPYMRYCSLIPDEDRLEIEDEEEELHNRLDELMKEYDISRAKFKGCALEFLDYFFELREQELADEDHWSSYTTDNYDDKDLLGPGRNYNFSQPSFADRRVLHRHTEEVREEDMLALLFREEE